MRFCVVFNIYVQNGGYFDPPVYEIEFFRIDQFMVNFVLSCFKCEICFKSSVLFEYELKI